MTLTPAKTPAKVPATVDQPKPLVKSPPPAVAEGACGAAPKWIGKPPCVSDGYLYGNASVKGTVMARARAAGQARRSLALALGAHLNDAYVLTDSEIPQVYVCEGQVHALARVKHTATGELSQCAAGQLDPAPPPQGCPEWTQRMAWKDGDTYYGVAPAARVLKAFQRGQMAANRARVNVTEMMKVTLELTPDGVTTKSDPVGLRELRRSKVDCDKVEFYQIAFAPGVKSAANLGRARVQMKKIDPALAPKLGAKNSSEP